MAKNVDNSEMDTSVVDMYIMEHTENDQSDFMCNVSTHNRFTGETSGRDNNEWKQTRKAKRKKVSSSTGSIDNLDTRVFDELSENKQRACLFETLNKNNEMLCEMKRQQSLYYKVTECLQTNVVNLTERTSAVERAVDDQNECLKMLTYRSIDTEARSRRNNLIIYGLSERINSSVEQIVCGFLEDEMGIDTQYIVIDRAHRLGYRSNIRVRTADDAKRPIIVRFRDYADTEHIMKRAYKLKGTQFGVDRDYPKEIAVARKALYTSQEARSARQDRRKVQILYPAKLIIDGQLRADKFPEWQKYMGQDRMSMIERTGRQKYEEKNTTEEVPTPQTRDPPTVADNQSSDSEVSIESVSSNSDYSDSDSESVFSVKTTQEDRKSAGKQQTCRENNTKTKTNTQSVSRDTRTKTKGNSPKPTRRHNKRGRQHKRTKVHLKNTNTSNDSTQKTVNRVDLVQNSEPNTNRNSKNKQDTTHVTAKNSGGKSQSVTVSDTSPNNNSTRL